ncbi:MAG: 2,4-dichlorophenol 6-monooxygenase [Pseudomonadota bacterium]|jgi:2-polyprenyl-6-methoxyphenol hydroxylase-like FAD-dependent oxidoreductase|nr:monooxygenase [Betaproteobacteria bacterium]
MTATLEPDVLIVGAGPVGMTLALCLAQRRVRCTVVEMKAAHAATEVKCNHISARSMEIYRRLGVAVDLRASGLPDDYPHDVSYRTSTVGQEITRIHIPGRLTRLTDHSGPDGWWPTPEPPHRLNQRFIEPILARHVQQQPLIQCLYQHQVIEVQHNDDEALVRCRVLSNGSTVTLRARYVVGCDGGRSLVRKSIGAQLVGDEVVQRVQSTCVRAPDLMALMKAPAAWAMFTVNPRRSGNVYAIDGRETWLIHNYLRDHESDFESVDRDWAIRTILGVGPDFQYELLSKEDWIGRRLVADKLRQGRVFIAGDSAHLWVPYAGYGMNAGIADADNLAWHLAAQLEGWASPSALDAYERERLPITEQVSHFAMNHAHAMSQRRRAIPADIEDAGDAADASRRSFGQDLYELNVQQYCCAGLNFGYYYDASPVMVYDDAVAPAYSMGSFTPSTVPGCRAPHVWLSDGVSLLDVLGTGFTLLCSPHARAEQTALMQQAMHAARVPLTVRVMDDRHTWPAEYRHAWHLIRQDSHVVWRGDQITPDLAMSVVACLRGELQA